MAEDLDNTNITNLTFNRDQNANDSAFKNDNFK